MKVVLLFFVFVTYTVFSQQIPQDRLYDWDKAGATIPIDRSNAKVLSLLDFGAVPNDLNDDAEALQSAINSTQGTFTIIEIPEGEYILSKAITLRDSCIIKGVSAEKSIFKCQFGVNGGSVFSVSGSAPSSFFNLEKVAPKSTRVIYVSIKPAPKVGQWVEIKMKNGAWDVNPASWAEHSVGQLSRINSFFSDAITLFEPLRFNTIDSLEPQIGIFTPKTYIGLECFSIRREEDTVTDAGHNIAFNYAVNCWVSSVTSHKSAGAHIFISKSSNITVSSSYFEESFKYDGSGTRGYGVCLAEHPNMCLIENNVFKTLRHAMMVKQGANANVFAYNYSLIPKRTEPIADYSGDISVHGHYPFANLFEGNIVQNIIIDHFWGPAGVDNMFFRNRTELYGFIITSSTTPSIQQNIVANDIPTPGLLYSQFLINGSEHFIWGNRVKGTLTPTTTVGVQPLSLFSATAPWYFENPSTNWQIIGYPITPINTNNPARERYQQGNQCPCVSPLQTTSIQEEKLSRIHTNSVELNRLFSSNNDVFVYTLTGAYINKCTSFEELQSLQLPKGLYILSSGKISSLFLAQ